MNCIRFSVLKRQVKAVTGIRSIAALADELRSKVSNFKGGSVELKKNDRSGIAEIHFSNPSKRNSFSGEMMVQLHDAVRELESWKQGKGLIVHSSERFFSSGGDLGMLNALDSPEKGAQVASVLHSALTGLQDLPLISVALVQGRALGAGAELTTACDFRIMAPGAEIQFVHVRMGVVPGCGGVTRLVRILGPTTALELLSSGRKVTSDDALKIGLVDHVLQSDESPLLDTKRWLGTYTAADSHIVQTIKRSIVKAQELSMADSLREDLKIFSTLWSGPANREALESKIKH